MRVHGVVSNRRAALVLALALLLLGAPAAAGRDGAGDGAATEGALQPGLGTTTTSTTSTTTTTTAPPVRTAPAATTPPRSPWPDAVGVATHLTYYGTPGGLSGDDPAHNDRIRALIADLGVKHLRDGWGPTGNDVAVAFVTDLHRSLGIDLTFVVDPRDGAGVSSRVAQLEQLAQAGVLDTIEGPNEWDSMGFTWRGIHLRSWMSQLVTAVRADPAFAQVKVAAPALAQTMDPSPNQQLGLIPNLDLGTTHNYPGNSVFVNHGSVLAAPSAIDAALAHIADTARSNARITAGASAPVIATETGFTTGSGGPYAPVTEAQQAELTVRMVMDYVHAGISRVFIYGLIANPSPSENAFEAGLSLVRYDLTPKPAFEALRGLLAS